VTARRLADKGLGLSHPCPKKEDAVIHAKIDAKILPVVLWMVGTLLSFSVMAVSIRELAGALSIFEVLAVRAGLGLAILLAISAVRPKLLRGVTCKHARLYVLRNVVNTRLNMPGPPD